MNILSFFSKFCPDRPYLARAISNVRTIHSELPTVVEVMIKLQQRLPKILISKLLYSHGVPHRVAIEQAPLITEGINIPDASAG